MPLKAELGHCGQFNASTVTAIFVIETLERDSAVIQENWCFITVKYKRERKCVCSVEFLLVVMSENCEMLLFLACIMG